VFLQACDAAAGDTVAAAAVAAADACAWLRGGGGERAEQHDAGHPTTGRERCCRAADARWRTSCQACEGQERVQEVRVRAWRGCALYALVLLSSIASWRRRSTLDVGLHATVSDVGSLTALT
jgi:hypothetical protein